MIEAIDHIEIVVRDIDEMADFFGRLGFVELRRTDHHGKAVEMQLPSGGMIFEFHTGLPIEPPGINHIAFKVRDCSAVADELKARGVPFDGGPKTAQGSGRVIANFRDPMYMRWQLTE